MDFEKPASNIIPIGHAFELQKNRKQQEALREMNKQIDEVYIDKLIIRVKAEQNKNPELLSEAQSMVAIIDEQEANMEEEGLLEEAQKLKALKLRLYQEISLYQEFFPYV